MIKLKDEEYRMFKEFIYDRFGITIGENKKHMLELKLNKLCGKNNITSCKEYFHLLSTSKDENYIIEFLNEVTINKTDFFRENHHFEFLTNKMSIIMNKNNRINITKEIRVWSSACSSGEEAYTIAMVLNEIMPPDIRIRILATDISYNVLQKAIQGEYPLTIKNQITPYFIQKYFKRIHDKFVIVDEIKEKIKFRAFNLKENFPFKGKFDIIFCRNVMIYFDAVMQEKLIHKFYHYTEKGGYLFIGHSESLSYIKHSYKYIEPTIYRKD